MRPGYARRGDEDVVHDPDPDPPTWRGSEHLGAAEESSRVPEGTLGRALNAFRL